MEKILIIILILTILLLLIQIKQLRIDRDSCKSIIKTDNNLIATYKEKIELLEKSIDDYSTFLERAMKSNKDLIDARNETLDLNERMLKKMSDCKHCNPNNIKLN